MKAQTIINQATNHCMQLSLLQTKFHSQPREVNKVGIQTNKYYTVSKIEHRKSEFNQLNLSRNKSRKA